MRQAQQAFQHLLLLLLLLLSFSSSSLGLGAQSAARLALGLLPEGVCARGRPEGHGGVDGHLLGLVGLQADLTQEGAVRWGQTERERESCASIILAGLLSFVGVGCIEMYGKWSAFVEALDRYTEI